MIGEWTRLLADHVERNPIIILRIDSEDWRNLRASRRGVGEFTTSYRHHDVARFSAPTLAIIVANEDGVDQLQFAVIGKPAAVTSLDSRIKLKRVFAAHPSRSEELIGILDQPGQARLLADRLAERSEITALTPKLSASLVRHLAAIEDNELALRSIASTLAMPRRMDGNSALQEQALRTALRTFGIGPEVEAEAIELLDPGETAIARLRVIEDGVIEHDARHIPGMRLADSDVTGRALFVRGDERLEVFTANRRPLEAALGVDLIYWNRVQGNIVMVQHKMLNRSPNGTRWIYRPDDQLVKEIQRMRPFLRDGEPNRDEYRLHSGVFYLKFFRNDASIRSNGILLPLDHYEKIVASPRARGPRQGVVIDYDELGGRYLREHPFTDLVRAGYIGAYAEDTRALGTIIDAILDSGKAVVAAIQSGRTTS